jgi:nicotinamide-nucleotide amidase
MMELLINQIHKLLIKKQKTVAVAESCTGGLVSNLLTEISGSSQYFILGVVAYSNRAKKIILKIPAQLIVKKGAVSKEVAERMAQEVRKIAGADFGIGISGIAGPTGEMPKKPLGTVFISIDQENNGVCKKFRFTGNRATVREKAALKALELLKTFL